MNENDQVGDDKSQRKRIRIREEDVDHPRKAHPSKLTDDKHRRRIAIDPSQIDLTRGSHKRTEPQRLVIDSRNSGEISTHLPIKMNQLLNDYGDALSRFREKSTQLENEYHYSLSERANEIQRYDLQLANGQRRIQQLVTNAEQLTREARSQTEETDELINISFAPTQIDWTNRPLLDSIKHVKNQMHQHLERLEQLVRAYETEPIRIEPTPQTIWERVSGYISDLFNNIR